jgi:hypothetical protein
MRFVLFFVLVLVFGVHVQSDFLDFERLGAIPHDRTTETAIFNGKLMNETWNNLKPFDVFFVPNKTFHVMGGIYASGWRHVVIRIDGTIKFSDDRAAWPRDESGNVLECMHLSDIKEVKFTSGGKGEDIIFYFINFNITHLSLFYSQEHLMVKVKNGGVR